MFIFFKWSRFSGGSGAPGWTFEIAGLDIKSFKETGAAYVHNTNAVPGDPLPMVWPTNYTKLACCNNYFLFLFFKKEYSKTKNNAYIYLYIQRKILNFYYFYFFYLISFIEF